MEIQRADGPDARTTQAIWIGGTVLMWGLLGAAAYVGFVRGEVLLAVALAAASVLVRFGLVNTFRWLLVESREKGEPADR